MTRKHSRKLVYESALALKSAIDSNPLSRANIQELIPNNEVGRNQLLPMFRQITGESVKAYQRRIRMQAAQKILTSGMTIKEVAIECGYRYVGNFSRDFKLIFGQGPEEWLKNQLVTKDDKRLEH
jgi:transcriptional regulator GlxA family with amidase domain